MTAVNPLFEFMPYGAPELIAAQRAHQMRALAVACGLAMLAFGLLLALGLKLADPIPVEVRLRDRTTTIHRTPQSNRVAEPASPRVEARTQVDPRSTPVPVPDIAVPPETQVLHDLGPSEGSSDGTIHLGDGAKARPTFVTEEAPPKWGDPPPDVLPQAIVIIKPKYPDLPKDLGIEGRVYVRMLVGKDGKVIRAEIDPKYSVPMLDESALTAARQWVFSPARTGGHPVAVWVGEMIVYRIE